MNLMKRRVSSPTKRVIRNYQPTYYSPFKNLFDMMDFDYGNLFDFGRQPDYYVPKLNMRDEGNNYVIEIDVPGYSEDQLDISLDGDQITISGNYSSDYKEKEGKYLVREKNCSNFVRTFSLPKESHIDEIKAQLNKGILSLYVPKAKGAVSPKQIEIETIE